jgi:Domain of unknown function (DUF892)
MDACLIAGGQRAEHYEMAAYGTLVAWARAIGHTDAADLLQETLDEERAADAKLSSLVSHPSATGPRGHETGYSVRRRWRRGRLGIGAGSPFSSWTRSPASTPYCDCKRAP